MKVVLDGTKMRSRRHVHFYIKNKLQFPGYYGKNLDALADCLSEMEEITEIELINKDSMLQSLGEYGNKLLSVFVQGAEDEFYTLEVK